MDLFWDGFEKRAAGFGFLATGLRQVGKAGKYLANKGLDMATNPAGNRLTQGFGKGIYHTGQFIKKHPRGVGIGAAGLGVAGAGYLASKALGGGDNRNAPAIYINHSPPFYPLGFTRSTFMGTGGRGPFPPGPPGPPLMAGY